MIDKVNMAEKLSKFEDYWNPRVVGDLNDTHVKLTKLKGEFIWHQHDNEDEPKTTLNTGNVTNERTVVKLERI